MTWIIAPDHPDQPKEVLFSRNYEDSYTDPGSPAMRRTSLGTYVLAQVDGERKLLMQGGEGAPAVKPCFGDSQDAAFHAEMGPLCHLPPPAAGSGASPEGNKPFLDVLDLDTRESSRIWQSSPPHYEYTSSILSDLEGATISLDNLRVLASRWGLSCSSSSLLALSHQLPGGCCAGSR